MNWRYPSPHHTSDMAFATASLPASFRAAISHVHFPVGLAGVGRQTSSTSNAETPSAIASTPAQASRATTTRTANVSTVVPFEWGRNGRHTQIVSPLRTGHFPNVTTRMLSCRRMSPDGVA